MEKKEILEEVFQAVYTYGFVYTIKQVCGEKTQLAIPFYPSFYKESIDALNLSVRSNNCLHRAEIDTVEKLMTAVETGNLLNIRSLGKKSIAEIRFKLVEAGFFALPEEKQKEVLAHLVFA